ncbi:MAG: hypothetical protein QOI59_2106 [Gammaproteobacteria bacterium]|nr:hypothetical protein [Gammaproteobacteria bacterium]
MRGCLTQQAVAQFTGGQLLDVLRNRAARQDVSRRHLARTSLRKFGRPVDVCLCNQSLETDAEQKHRNESQSGGREATPNDARTAVCSL